MVEKAETLKMGNPAEMNAKMKEKPNSPACIESLSPDGRRRGFKKCNGAIVGPESLAAIRKIGRSTDKPIVIDIRILYEDRPLKDSIYDCDADYLNSARCRPQMPQLIEVYRRFGCVGKFECIAKTAPSDVVNGMSAGVAAEIERALNHGLLCHEAEAAWLKLRFYDRATFKVCVASSKVINANET